MLRGFSQEYSAGPSYAAVPSKAKSERADGSDGEAFQKGPHLIWKLHFIAGFRGSGGGSPHMGASDASLAIENQLVMNRAPSLLNATRG